MQCNDRGSFDIFVCFSISFIQIDLAYCHWWMKNRERENDKKGKKRIECLTGSFSLAFIHKIDYYYFLYGRHHIFECGYTFVHVKGMCFFSSNFNYCYCLVNRHNTLRWNAFQLILFSSSFRWYIWILYVYINDCWSVSIHIKSNCELYAITYLDGKHMTIAVTQKKTHTWNCVLFYINNILQSRHKSYVFLSPKKKLFIHSHEVI